jgi:hypothetical protein
MGLEMQKVLCSHDSLIANVCTIIIVILSLCVLRDSFSLDFVNDE